VAKPIVRVLMLVSFTAATALAGCAADDEGDDGEDLGESEDMLLAGRHFSAREVASVIRAAGFPESVVGEMVCTAKYESSFYERARNYNPPRNGRRASYDYGLFQINTIHLGKPGCPSSASGLYDATANARCALSVYRAQGLTAWYGYQRHRTECNNYQAPSSGGTVISTPTDDLGGCWSATVQDMLDAGVCVQSKFDNDWYQCRNGRWYNGVSGSQGPYGACTAQFPLRR
jgi:hypothetical protein